MLLANYYSALCVHTGNIFSCLAFLDVILFVVVVVVGIIFLALTLLDSLHMVGCGQDHF